MSDVRLVGLEVKDMGPWVGKHTLDLPDPGLYLILGQVAESGGGSGAGKSYLLNSIPYVMGGCPFSGTDLQSWYTEETPSATVRLLAQDQSPVDAWRDSKGLFYQKAKERLKGGAAATAIDRLLGMGPDLRAQATFMAQGESAGFLGLKPAEKMTFLSTVLGLEEAETGAERLMREANAALKRLEAAKGAVGACEAALARAQAALAALPALGDLEDHQAALDAAQVALEALREAERAESSRVKAAGEESNVAAAKYLAEERRITAEIERIQRESYEPPARLIEASLRASQELLARCASIREANDARSKQIASLNRALAEPTADAAQEKGAVDAGRHALAQIKLLQQQTCPTCERQWVDVKAGTALQAEVAKVEAAKAAVRKARAGAKKVAELREQIRALSEQPAEQPPASSPDLDAVKEAWSAACTAWEGDRDARVSALRGERGRIPGVRKFDWEPPSLVEARAAVKAAEAEVERRKVIVQKTDSNRLARESAEKAVKEATDALTAARVEEESLRVDAAARADGGDMLRAFSVGYAEEALGAVAERANVALGAVPNVAHVSISFSVERETKSGSVVKRIEPKVRTRGREVSFTSGISGGMQTPIRRAVDLALGEVVAARGGTYPGWLILDEALNGLGAVEKSACLGVLAEFASKRTILVVDHDATFQGLFSRIITVQQENGRSSLAISG